MAAQWSEQFSQQRMNKYLGVFQKIVNNWAKTNRFECRVVAEESLEGKTLTQIARMYFSVGVGINLTDMPFLDMLIVFKMLADHHTNFKARGKGKRPKNYTEKYQIKTSFTEDETFAMLRDIENKIGIEVQRFGKRNTEHGDEKPKRPTCGLDVLEAFPELKALGRDAVQSLCDDWLRKPKAREFAISELIVRNEGSKLVLNFRVDMTHKVADGEEYHFPMDDLLLYLADRGVQAEASREHVKAQIIEKRRQAGPDVYQRFQVNLGPELPLFLTCKNDDCKLLMMTQLKGRKCERAIWGPEKIECPDCHRIYEYNQDDLHFGPA